MLEHLKIKQNDYFQRKTTSIQNFEKESNYLEYVDLKIKSYIFIKKDFGF